MTFSQLAIKVSPYFTTLITIQLVLTCVAILFGVFLILRRFLGHTDAPHSALENEQIAAEITEEMRRLSALRAKILPGAYSKSADEGAHHAEGAHHSEGAHHEPAPKAAGDHAANEKLVQSYETRIKELESKLASGTATPAATAGSAGDGKLELALATSNKEKDDLSQKLAHVEKVLSEYKIFEEDFALVKKYKAENDRLKSQMAAGGAPSTAVSPDDINNLFNSLSGPKVEAKAPPEVVDPSKFFDNEFSAQAQPAPSPAPVQEAPAATAVAPAPQAAAPEPIAAAPSPEPVVAQTPTPAPAPAPEVAAPAQTPTPAPAPAEVASPTPPPAEAAAPAPAEMTAPAPAPAAAGTEATPAIDPAPANSKIVAEEKAQDLEALAESAVNDDQLMQEFEKILGDKK